MYAQLSSEASCLVLGVYLHSMPYFVPGKAAPMRTVIV